MRCSSGACSVLWLFAWLAWGQGESQPAIAQTLGDRPLAVPQAGVTSDSQSLQRLPAVKKRASAPAAPAAPTDVIRFPETGVDELAPWAQSPFTQWLPNYATPREQFVPTAWLRWAQQTEPATDGAGAPANGATEAPEGNGEAEGEKKPEIGPKPPEDINRLALRGTNLLLKPGDLQYELSPLYVVNHQQVLAILPDNSIVMQRIRSHLMMLPISVRYGWSENCEIFAVTPFGLSTYQADNQYRNLNDEAGVLGDISFGLVRALPKFKWIPNTTLALNVTTPTGVSPDFSVSTNQASLGNGVWRIGAMLNFVQSVDPFVLFAGLGYDHPFEKEIAQLPLQLGDSFNFYGGVGFAVTDDISLSAQINGSLQAESQLAGIHIANSDIEPVSMRVAVIRRLTLKSRVQPYVSWGLTEDAADYSLGVRFVHDR